MANPVHSEIDPAQSSDVDKRGDGADDSGRVADEMDSRNSIFTVE